MKLVGATLHSNAWVEEETGYICRWALCLLCERHPLIGLKGQGTEWKEK
jgi:hypothetical protein